MSAGRFALPVPGGRLCGDARGAGPPVVLLHGFTLDRRAWDAQVDALAAGHRVVRVDLRGHGASSDATAPYRAGDDVARVLDALALPQAALVGLSWGGAVALDAALDHPARVSALALVDSTLPGHDWSPAWRGLTARLKALAEGPDGAREAARAWFGSELFAPARTHPELGPLLAEWETPRAGRAWAGRDPALAAQPLAAGRLGSVAVPSLVVVGEHDLPDYQAIARALAEGIRGARRVVIAGAGHLPNLEAPAALTRELLAFLAHASGAPA